MLPEAPSAACPEVVIISDQHLIGAHGAWGTVPLPNTDPRNPPYGNLKGTLVHYYAGPGLTVGEAEALADQANVPLTYTVGPVKPPDGDTDGDAIPNGSDPDDDNDGCPDTNELGPDEALGGLRNPHDYWDFYDVWTHPVGDPEGWERNASIDVFGDIFGVASRFGATGDPDGDPLVPPDDETGYHPAFDRGAQTGANPWDMGSPDGAIDLFIDIFGVANQFGHDCSEPP